MPLPSRVGDLRTARAASQRLQVDPHQVRDGLEDLACHGTAIPRIWCLARAETGVDVMQLITAILAWQELFDLLVVGGLDEPAVVLGTRPAV